MNIQSIRFCHVSGAAEELANLLSEKLGPERHAVPGAENAATFPGAISPTASDSWVEIWPESDRMPAGTMLQIIVDDADAVTEHAKRNGLQPHGPGDSHGEKICYIHAPGGLPMTCQSKQK